ncbi:MAG: hypothetical protein QOI84_503 [Solirubrobacterales bacterium]|jgi:NO-binding membrane sensor protein with MHYT domain|nr:hypothetical protein [Solirubrobacterales bacterium]
MHVLAATFANRETFDAIIAGVSAFAAVAGFFSAFAGFVSALRGDSGTEIANATAIGFALAAPVGLIVAGVDVADLLTKTAPLISTPT